MPVNIYRNTAGGGEQIRVAWLGDDEWSLPAQAVRRRATVIPKSPGNHV